MILMNFSLSLVNPTGIFSAGKFSMWMRKSLAIASARQGSSTVSCLVISSAASEMMCHWIISGLKSTAGAEGKIGLLSDVSIGMWWMWKVISTLALVLVGCSTNDASEKEESLREWKSSFESISDFNGFYITEQNHLNSTFHIQDSINVRTGKYAHKAWIEEKNEPSTKNINNNHRGYPTVQLYKTNEGGFRSPFYFELYVWVDADLIEREEDDWISLATFSDSKTDSWERTVLVNLSWDGFLHLAHVPNQGLLSHTFQTKTIRFPQREWVKVSGYFQFGEEGSAKVWQNDELVSESMIENTIPELNQAHFGLYAPPHMESGVVYNDDLLIQEVNSSYDFMP